MSALFLYEEGECGALTQEALFIMVRKDRGKGTVGTSHEAIT